MIVHDTLDLTPVLAGWAAGVVPPERFQAAFDEATLYVQRVDGPDGVPAVAGYGDEGERYVAVYTSLRQLARHVTRLPGGNRRVGVDWAAAPGRDLAELVPEGCGLVVDPAGPHPAVLPASAIRRGVVIAREPR